MACKGGTLSDGANKFYPNAYYEIGDLFFTTRNENPSIRFGGTWELFGKGRTLVCVDTSDSDFSTVKKTGGEKTHTLTSGELAEHDHIIYSNTDYRSSPGVGYWGWGLTEGYCYGDEQNVNNGGRTRNTGSNQPHNNLQPYITCFIWIRIK